MALSKEEQRLLDQLEAELAAEDPQLDDALRTGRGRKIRRLRIALLGVGFLAAMALLVVGAFITPFLSVLGYALMVAVSVAAVHVLATSSALTRYANRPDMAMPPRIW